MIYFQLFAVVALIPAITVHKAVSAALSSPHDELPESKLSVADVNLTVSRARRQVLSCKHGWLSYEGSCYTVVKTKQPVSWYKAQQTCYNIGGNLPTIATQQEDDFVMNRIFSLCSGHCKGYLGYHDKLHENTFLWIDGTSSSFTNWRKGEPNNMYESEDCVQTIKSRNSKLNDQKWNDIPCNVKYSNCFVCEDSRFCPNGWTSFGNKCYRLFHNKSKISWEVARHVCQAASAELVSIESHNEQAFLNSFLNKRDWYYIGYSDKSKEGSWQWTDGTQSDFANWEEDEPNDADGFGSSGMSENCAAAHAGRKWNDIYCMGSYYKVFVCEM